METALTNTLVDTVFFHLVLQARGSNMLLTIKQRWCVFVGLPVFELAVRVRNLTACEYLTEWVSSSRFSCRNSLDRLKSRRQAPAKPPAVAILSNVKLSNLDR